MRVDGAALAPLPGPVRHSLESSGVVGTHVPSGVTITQQGRIRQSAAGRWLPFDATETYSVAPPGFEWRATLKVAGVPAGRAVDTLERGAGRMKVRLAGLLPVVDAAGPEMDQGSLLRWLNETMWFPAVWASGSIRWEPVDSVTAIGSVTAEDLSVSAEFVFDEAGRLVDFRADRYRDVGGSFELTPWSTPLTEHGSIGGVTVPTRGSGVWKLPDGDFEYVQIRLTGLHYSG